MSITERSRPGLGVLILVLLVIFAGSAFAANQLLAEHDDDVLLALCSNNQHTRVVHAEDECRGNEEFVEFRRSELKGDHGEIGPAGLNCWDLNGNGIKDPQEDTDGDGVVDIFDCRALGEPTPTATPTETTEPPDPGDNARVVRAFSNLQHVIGIAHFGPNQTGVTNQLGGIEEDLFVFEDGSAMTPELVESWDIDPAGTRVRLTLRDELKFQPPRGYEFHDFGQLDAYEFTEWFNRSNLTTNPDSQYPDGSDLAGILLEAFPTGPLTVEIGLVSPIFYCLPLSDFGCLSTDRGPHKVTTVDEFDWNWANSHHIGTGPYVQGACLAHVQCTLHAVDDHWRVEPQVKEYVGIQVPDDSVKIALLATGGADMAEFNYDQLSNVLSFPDLRFIETMPGGFVGQSVIFPGNLWEEFHARTGEPLNPWDSEVYDVDRPWLGDPWQDSNPGNVRYVDTNNPAGMTDMEQARLVRLALSTAIDRNFINDDVLNNIGTPIYSEYMGPEYPGWDPGRMTGNWDVEGNRISSEGTAQSVRWELADGDLSTADALLTAAGFPPDTRWDDFGGLPLQTYCAETGCVNFPIADRIAEAWQNIGINAWVEGVDYGGVVSPRMRQRIEYFPVLKNGDVHSNVFPLDWPLPQTDTSSSRPGWGVGFESPAGARWLFEIFAERDPAVREHKHFEWVDYSMFWVQYAGVYQVPKGIVVGERIEAWNGRQEHYRNVSNDPEFIVLK